LLRDNKLWVAHVGDSRAVLSDGNAAITLTKDHKASDPDEQEMLKVRGGNVRNVSARNLARVIWKRAKDPKHAGPITSETPAHEVPFLNMTRSLGDLWSWNHDNQHYNVSPDPEVSFRQLEPGNTTLVVASDGVWDVLSAEECLECVAHTLVAKTAAKQVLAEKATAVTVAEATAVTPAEEGAAAVATAAVAPGVVDGAGLAVLPTASISNSGADASEEDVEQSENLMACDDSNSSFRSLSDSEVDFNQAQEMANKCAAEVVVSTAERKWATLSKGRADNISAVVVFTKFAPGGCGCATLSGPSDLSTLSRHRTTSTVDGSGGAADDTSSAGAGSVEPLMKVDEVTALSVAMVAATNEEQSNRLERMVPITAKPVGLRNPEKVGLLSHPAPDDSGVEADNPDPKRVKYEREVVTPTLPDPD
jgi:hypothetical protein